MSTFYYKSKQDSLCPHSPLNSADLYYQPKWKLELLVLIHGKHGWLADQIYWKKKKIGQKIESYFG